jgi:hypothetical protein
MFAHPVSPDAPPVATPHGTAARTSNPCNHPLEYSFDEHTSKSYYRHSRAGRRSEWQARSSAP